MSDCLDDNTAAEFASGSLPKAAATRVEGHLATCRSCRMLVAALAGDGSSEDLAEALPPPRGKRGHALGHLSTRVASPDHVHTVPSAPASTGDPGAAPGDTIGRYQVLGRLGAGGMGVVLSAYDPQLDRKIALKLLRPGAGLASREARARLVREAQAIAQLSHPNVVAVFDVGTTGGEVYIAMELVDGETLTRWLRAWERPWRDVLDIFLQAGRGLVAAHAVGLLHRDFKPDNVLVGSDGRVRVTDFGLARSLLGTDEPLVVPVTVRAGALHQSLTATGTVLGTPRYMAPEQLRGDDADARADQFSFCVALYEAIYGHHPLPGDTAQQMVDDGARAAPPPESPVPPWLGAALSRGLDASPARRFPSMSALLGELTPPPAPSKRRWAALGIGLALAAGGAAFALSTGDNPPPPMSPAERDRLLAMIKRLETERAQLRRELQRVPAQTAELRQIHAKLDRAEGEIQNLRDELAIATGRPTPMSIGVARAPRVSAPPAAPALSGVSVRDAATALGTAQHDVLDCLGEWAGRHPGDRRAFAVTLAVLPSGTTHSLAADGMGSDPTVECVAYAIARSPFAHRNAQTRLRVMVTLAGGKIELAPTVLAVEPAPEPIDLGAGAPL